jgi:hypothetical protein
MDKLPNPVWHKYFGIGGKKLVLTFSEPELQFKAGEVGLSDKACLGRIGRIGQVSTFEIFQGKMTPGKKKVYEEYVGIWPKHSWGEIQELGLKHVIFLPNHGCFGFINGCLIVGNRHHQEVMFRLINEKGWTWEQLMNADQVWGWFSHYGDSGTITFSSDAGTMTSKKIKNQCIAEFSEWFGKPFSNDGGYGGKKKSEYGGDFKSKYGDPETGTWDGYRAEEDSTILTPLPDPPEA